MADLMQFPETFEEFAAIYGFPDGEEVYTNGARLIPAFRVEQWLEHIDQKHGKWIKINNTTNSYYCSECKEKRWWMPNVNEVHYCPNCGAKMEGIEYETY